MQTYDPEKSPDPEAWLSLDESERITLIEDFHTNSGEEVPEGAERIHAVIHVIVENQCVIKTEPAAAIIAKLIRQGLDRHEALHAVGAILAENLFNLQKGNDTSWNKKKYYRRLDKLSAKRWRKGLW